MNLMSPVLVLKPSFDKNIELVLRRKPVDTIHIEF